MEARRIYAITAMQMVRAGVLLWLSSLSPVHRALQSYAGTGLAVGVGRRGRRAVPVGKVFAIKAEANEQVTTGMYSKIRNPTYGFGTVISRVWPGFFERPSAWVFAVAVIVGQRIRAHREAGVLETVFADAYPEYRRKTWF